MDVDVAEVDWEVDDEVEMDREDREEVVDLDMIGWMCEHT